MAAPLWGRFVRICSIAMVKSGFLSRLFAPVSLGFLLCFSVAIPPSVGAQAPGGKAPASTAPGKGLTEGWAVGSPVAEDPEPSLSDILSPLVVDRGIIGLLALAGEPLAPVPGSASRGWKPFELAAAFLRANPSLDLPPDIVDERLGLAYEVRFEDPAIPMLRFALDSSMRPLSFPALSGDSLYRLDFRYGKDGLLLRIRIEELGPAPMLYQKKVEEDLASPQEEKALDPSRDEKGGKDGTPSDLEGSESSSQDPVYWTISFTRSPDGLPREASILNGSELLAAAAFSFSGDLRSCDEAIYDPEGNPLAGAHYTFTGGLPRSVTLYPEGAYSYDYGLDGLPWSYQGTAGSISLVYGPDACLQSTETGPIDGAPVLRRFQWDGGGLLVRELLRGEEGTKELSFRYSGNPWIGRRALILQGLFGVSIPAPGGAVNRVPLH